MTPLASLWVPVLLSAVLVFLASSLIHMVFKWHEAEYRKLPDEDGVRAAIQRADPVPGQYVLPWCLDPKAREGDEARRRYEEGPVALVWLMPRGQPALGRSLGQWFLFNLVLAFLLAYLAAHTLGPGRPWLAVFRVVGTAAFLAHGLGQVPGSIWMGKPWRATAKDLLDALIFALVTAGTFAWLWPR